MKVLMLTTSLPHPPTSGGTLRVWNILREVASRHEVTLLTLQRADEAVTPESLAAVREFAREVEVVPRPVKPSWKMRNALASLSGARPYTLGNFHTRRFAAAISRRVATGGYDLVHAQFIHTAQYWRCFGDAARYFDCHNINVHLWERYAATQTSGWRKAFALRQARLLSVLEPEIHRQFDVTTFVSDIERDFALGKSPGCSLFTSPNGVDCEAFRPGSYPGEPGVVVFCASFDATQNSDAAVFLAEEVVPRILSKGRRVRLYLVGRRPSARVRALEGPHVVVTGLVDDVRPYVSRASVVVAPIRIAGGTRLKILEAMAMGKAVVSTTVGAEGIACENGRDIVLADTPDALADAITKLDADPVRRRSLGVAARKLVEERHAWPIIGRIIESCYHTARENAARRQARESRTG
jgi:polysaccharide biosynthesis protein PslH